VLHEYSYYDLESTIDIQTNQKPTGDRYYKFVYFVAHSIFTLISAFEAEAHLNNFLGIQSVPRRKQHFTITKINWLTLFKEIIAVYTENHTKYKYTLWPNAQLLNVKECGTHSYHWVLKG
jgi:hypothetical protein